MCSLQVCNIWSNCPTKWVSNWMLLIQWCVSNDIHELSNTQSQEQQNSIHNNNVQKTMEWVWYYVSWESVHQQRTNVYYYAKQIRRTAFGGVEIPGVHWKLIMEYVISAYTVDWSKMYGISTRPCTTNWSGQWSPGAKKTLQKQVHECDHNKQTRASKLMWSTWFLLHIVGGKHGCGVTTVAS